MGQHSSSGARGWRARSTPCDALRARGVPLVGYTWWPLFALVAWATGRTRARARALSPPMGLYELDPETRSRACALRSSICTASDHRRRLAGTSGRVAERRRAVTPRSFFLAGFECATGYNRHGEWIDQIAATQHDLFVDDDYRRLRDVGILAVRETVRWPLVDRGGRYDFTTVAPILEASRRHGIELDLRSLSLRLSGGRRPLRGGLPAALRRLLPRGGALHRRRRRPAVRFTPVNEPSYFAWAAGEAALFAPHCRGRGPELKLQLARAGIAGVERDPRRPSRRDDRRASTPSAAWCARTIDPTSRDEVVRFNDDVVFESWDMLAGRLHPELGGSRGAPRHDRRQLLLDEPVGARAVRASRSPTTTRDGCRCVRSCARCTTATAASC